MFLDIVRLLLESRCERPQKTNVWKANDDTDPNWLCTIRHDALRHSRGIRATTFN